MNASNRPQRGEFYVLQPDIRGGGPGHGIVIENEEALLTPPRMIIRPVNGGIPELPETPRLIHKNSGKRLPRDLEGGFSGYWLVSERLKNVFESTDADAFQFSPCSFIAKDGTQSPPYYLCDVVRTIEALDRENSSFKTEIDHDFETGEACELISFLGGASLSFHRDAIGSAHVFRMAENELAIICDRVMYEAIRNAGIGVKASSDGLWFMDAASF